MARRDNTSCAGIGCVGYLLLNLVVIVGGLLATPVLIPDLMALQDPPVRAEGPGAWAILYGIPVVVALAVTALAGRGAPFAWRRLLARAALLLAAVAGAVLYTGHLVEGIRSWNARGALTSGAAGLVALAVYLGIRRWDRTRGARPRAGEIWLAMVPLREDPSRHLRHYCVVLATGRGGAEVAQITTKDKDGRRDHVPLPNDGWDEVSGRPHWVEIGHEPRVVPYRKFLASRPQGRCPDVVWSQLRSRRTVSAPPSVPGSRMWARIRRI
ncbi:hypothetical protein ACQEVM_11870 [Streptomyces sp. CA-243310]|uniref:hypothetical protein n=1 Tax=Streptomyces sp. CA-243310 TaxID=3240056 RepID=UPI003D8CBCA2